MKKMLRPNWNNSLSSYDKETTQTSLLTSEMKSKEKRHSEKIGVLLSAERFARKKLFEKKRGKKQVK